MDIRYIRNTRYMNPETATAKSRIYFPFFKVLRNKGNHILSGNWFRKDLPTEPCPEADTMTWNQPKTSQSIMSRVNVNKRKVALITGATSGIGKEFASEFARQQYDLIITGRRKKLIDCVAGYLRSTYGISVRVVIADLMDRSDIQRLLEIIEHEHNLEVLVNNAGYGLARIFHDDDINHQLDMVKVHIDAPLILIHKALPMMINNKKGVIINVSSLAAFIPTSNNIMYTSTKSFLLNFTESLNLAVKQHGIHLQCLCPGFTRTDFHNKIGLHINSRRIRLFSWMEPSQVVKYSMRYLYNGKVLCIPGFMNRMIVFLMPFAPRSFYYFIARKLQQESGFTDPISPQDNWRPETS